MWRKVKLLLLLFLAIFPSNILAYSDYIVASGDNIGIKIQTKGIIVIGTYDIDGQDPATKAGLKEGDIIVLTTHQLYRYEHYFDLLILDEIDAFPYRDNEVLHALFLRSMKGNYCLMSATPSDKVIEEFKKENHEMLTLFHRYHHHPLPVPQIKIRYFIFKELFVIKKLKEYEKENKPVLVFCATIRECESLYEIVKLFIKRGNYVHSKRKERAILIEDFRNNKYSYLITTSVLERGVTLKNLQVIIFNSDNELYNSAALIQIAGRVGRVKDFPSGDIYYVSKKRTKEMDKSIRTIENYNKDL